MSQPRRHREQGLFDALKVAGRRAVDVVRRVPWPLVAWLVVAVVGAGVGLGTLPPGLASTHAASALTAGRLGLSPHWSFVFTMASGFAAFASLWAVALILVWRRPHDRMALFASAILIGVGSTPPNATIALLHGPWLLVTNLLGSFAWTSVFLFFYVFPDGRFTPRWTLAAAAVWVGMQALPYVLPSMPVDPNPFPPAFAALVTVALVGSCVWAQVYRYRFVSGAVQRQQTKWVLYGFALGLGGAVAYSLYGEVAPVGPVYAAADTLVVPLAMVVMAASLAMAIRRHRLWDIDILINRSLVYGVLTLTLVAVYALVVGRLAALLPGRGGAALSFVAVGLVAVLFAPLRERLQRAINRLMYGQRDEPYAVLTGLARRLEESLAPAAALPAIVATVAQSLRLPHAAIVVWRDGVDEVAASWGRPPAAVDGALEVPLAYQGERVGALRLAPRTPGEPFTPRDRHLLEDLARQAGLAVYAYRVTAELQRSRERLVSAREEERRRLRRDLHDGLGPQLAGLTLKLETARNRLAHEPLAEPLLLELIDRTQSAVADIRRLVYALRPPALDELGLLSALKEQALHMEHDGLSIRVEAPQTLPVLPAAAEVATYRIVQEALANVVRHAHARTCVVGLGFESEHGLLRIEIRDDGVGPGAHGHAGVGLLSMRERAAELGGVCSVDHAPEGGTWVRATLPCRGAAGA